MEPLRGPSTDAQHDATRVDLALGELITGLDHLVRAVEDGGLDYYEADELTGFMQAFERFRNRLSLVDHRTLRDADHRQLATHFTHSTLTSLLVHLLRLSPAEAARRVRAAEAVGERVSMLGEPLQPIRPGLAALQRTGGISPDQVSVIERALHSIDRPGLDPVEVAEVEGILTRRAASFGPRELRLIATHLTDAIRPDGTLPDEQVIWDRRDFRLSPNTDGSYRCEGRLTPALAAMLTTVLNPLAKPRINTVTGPSGQLIEQPDSRSFGQRMHDGLEDACARLLKAGGLPMSGGTPTTLIVTIGYQELLNRTGHGETSTGVLIPAREVLRIANEADIVPAVFSTSGALLDLGRSRRIASNTQTLALIARDHGCTFPGCSHPPEYCDRHHIKEWIDGGQTNLNNLALLCRYHHTHFHGHGWICKLDPDGIPTWVPPKWIDPQQGPLTNTRVQRHQQRLKPEKRLTGSLVCQPAGAVGATSERRGAAARDR